MNYFEKKYIFYFEILKRLTTGNDRKISEILSKVFCLKKENLNKINALLRDGTYKRLKSADMIRIHINAVETFCKNKGFFGETIDQKDVLESKFKALAISEKINLCDCAEMFLSEYSDNPIYVCIFAFLQTIKNKNTEADILQSFIARGVRDAGLIYASLFKNGREKVLCELNRSALFSDDEINNIFEYYSIKKENISELKKYGMGFGINNERIGL